MFRIDESFILQLIKLLIRKQDSLMRQSVSASERLQVTLRFLATGRPIFNKKLSYRKQTAHKLQRQSLQYSSKYIQNSDWSLQDVDGPS